MPDPYRTPALLPDAPKPKSSRWFMPICLVIGHRWAIIRARSGCGSIRMHDALFGCDADCTRCGKKHRDYLSPIVQQYLDETLQWIAQVEKSRTLVERMRAELRKYGER